MSDDDVEEAALSYHIEKQLGPEEDGNYFPWWPIVGLGQRYCECKEDAMQVFRQSDAKCRLVAYDAVKRGGCVIGIVAGTGKILMMNH